MRRAAPALMCLSLLPSLDTSEGQNSYHHPLVPWHPCASHGSCSCWVRGLRGETMDTVLCVFTRPRQIKQMHHFLPGPAEQEAQSWELLLTDPDPACTSPTTPPPALSPLDTMPNPTELLGGAGSLRGVRSHGPTMRARRHQVLCGGGHCLVQPPLSICEGLARGAVPHPLPIPKPMEMQAPYLFDSHGGMCQESQGLLGYMSSVLAWTT